MNSYAYLWPMFVLLALFIGFSAERASICTVKAIEEWLTSRRAFYLLCFLKTVLWATGVGILLQWLFGVVPADAFRYEVVFLGILGGLLFGVGAVLNNGCAFSTINRLGGGNIGMLLTLLGFAIGISMYAWYSESQLWTAYVPMNPRHEFNNTVMRIVGLVLAVWMIWELARQLRLPDTSWRQRMLAKQYRLSSAAIIIGLSNGILFTFIGAWTYTNTLRRTVSNVFSTQAKDAQSMMLVWWLFIALFAGAMISALIDRRCKLQWRPRRAWTGYLSGGLLMGIGVAVVPGGNDVLLLNAMPALSPHAVPAFLAMLAGIALALKIKKKLGGEIAVVECRGDVCRIVVKSDL